MSSPPSISTAHRIAYAQGYLALGLADDALEEIRFVSDEERDSDAILEIMMDAHGIRKDWQAAVPVAQEYARRHPGDSKGWISWAFAVRRLESLPAAEQILLEAEKHIGATCALVHYNLACYRCQLGDPTGALHRLARACRLESHWKAAALTDPDLVSLKSEIAALPFT